MTDSGKVELTMDYLMEIEKTLTEKQMSYALSLADKNGWNSGYAPLWVWYQFYREAQKKYPN